MSNDKVEPAVVLFSGGQDSTTCLYWAMKRFHPVYPLGFNYGQKHDIEIRYARMICKTHDIRLKYIDLAFMAGIMDNLLVADDDDEAISNKEDEGISSVFVPNRNQLFLTIAHAYAQFVEAKAVIIGVCQTDFQGFPDCRDNFIKGLQTITNLGSAKDIRFETPLMFLSKAEIFLLAQELGVLGRIIEETHTCYNGDHKTGHTWGYGCGNCSACIQREKGWEEFVADYETGL